MQVQDGGAIMGGPAITAGCGDLYIRNIQGSGPNHNLDLGGGSTELPGDVIVNYDVGDAFGVYDGTKSLLLRSDDAGTDVFRRLRIDGLDVGQQLLYLQVKAQRLDLRLDRLKRRMGRLSRLLRVERSRRIQADRRLERRP